MTTNKHGIPINICLNLIPSLKQLPLRISLTIRLVCASQSTAAETEEEDEGENTSDPEETWTEDSGTFSPPLAEAHLTFGGIVRVGEISSGDWSEIKTERSRGERSRLRERSIWELGYGLRDAALKNERV